jgi:predicted RNA-binding protein with PUA-like domain
VDLHIAAGFSDIHATAQLAGQEYAKSVFFANDNYFTTLITAHRNDTTWDTLEAEISGKLDQEYDLVKVKEQLTKLAPAFINDYSQELIDAFNMGFTQQFEAIVDSRLAQLGV